MTNSLLNSLNPDQQICVLETEGYIRIIAGAGSGKTKVLTHRYAHLVQNLDIPTKSILCVTFTNKAAQEMKNRIKNLIGDHDTAYISTFHSFCVTILREDIHTLNYPKQFFIIDNEDKKTILRKVYEDCQLSQSDITFKNAIDFISKNKDIDFLINSNTSEISKKYNLAKQNPDPHNKILYGYIYEQKKAFGLDFDDLIYFTLYIFRNFKKILKKWQERLQYIMVDEFQDVSERQYILVSYLSQHHKNLFIVGDPDQTIYSWRGSQQNFILDFNNQFKNVKTFVLNKNYRSTQNILDVANSLISNNKDRIKKDLSAVKTLTNPVIYNHLKTAKLETDWIIKEIKKLKKQKANYRDIAILYRAHYCSRTLEDGLIRAKIPYTIYSGISFYERREVKDILSYMRFLLYKDDISFLRIINTPKRGIGKKKIELIQNTANQNSCSLYSALIKNIKENRLTNTHAMNFVKLFNTAEKKLKTAKLTDILEFLLTKSGYQEELKRDGDQERLDNLAELKQSIIEYESHFGEKLELTEYLQQISLLTNQDKKTTDQNSIKLMTIHTAKGLEFPYVFLCSLSEGIFPSYNVKSNTELEEERRLAYVAITRAELKLFLSDSEGLNFDNSFRYPSRFILEINPKLLTFITKLDEEYKNQTKQQITRIDAFINNTQMHNYEVGSTINHKYLGKGTLIEYNQNDNTGLIKFENIETPRLIKIKS
ncbi:MAG: UvrD-helicase domain-containing protein [Alphaproteobacteria bacterium]|nr:UvrD-helicase domain-containing protein [Alphaproteobacteria bacterium]